MLTRRRGDAPARTDAGRSGGTDVRRDPPSRRHPTFAVVRRSYDTTQVDQHLAWLDAAPEPGEDEAYLEADRVIADARRLAAEIRVEAARREREAEAALERARAAVERGREELDAARAEASRLLADARRRAAEMSAFHDVA